MINLIFAIVGIVLAFNLGMIYTEKEYKKILIEFKELQKRDVAWVRHCKALREIYQDALNEERQKHRNGTKKIIVNERKYYVELDKIHLIYEDDKLVGWYNPNADDVDGE
jgi:hypothetical protein